MKMCATIIAMSVAILCSLTMAASVVESYDVRAYGAKGDGKTKDTQALQRAIDAASAAGGGTVELPSGTYVTGTLLLRDNVDFHLSVGATLLGSPDRADYLGEGLFPQNISGRTVSSSHLVLGIGCRNVTLRGPGKIAGNSAAFLIDPDTCKRWESKPGHPWVTDIPWRPFNMVLLVDARDVRILDLELADSPCYSCTLLDCERAWVRGCYIHTSTDPLAFNGDGLGINRSRHVVVSDCVIDTSDDCLTLRAGEFKPNPANSRDDCAFVTVANCVLKSTCSAVRVGCGHGSIHDATLSGLVIENASTALNFVSGYTHDEPGAEIRDIVVSNVRVHEAKTFLKIHHMRAGDRAVSGLRFENVSGCSRGESFIYAKSVRPFGGILFSNVDVTPGVQIVNAPEVEFRGGSFSAVKMSAADAEALSAAIDEEGKILY